MTKFVFLPSRCERSSLLKYGPMVRPILEYGSTVWDPHCKGLKDELENMQKRAARFVKKL